MHGIYASVTAYTKKRIKYADEIEELNKRLERENKFLQDNKTAKQRFLEKHEKELELIVLLQKHIADRCAAADKCNSDDMMLEEAEIKLDELKKVIENL